MTEAQHGIFTEGAPHHLYLEMTVAPDASPANLRQALGTLLGAPGVAGPEVVIAFGSELWSSLGSAPLPSELRPFDPLTSPGGYHAPATQRDLWIWIQSASPDVNFDKGMAAGKALDGIASVDFEVTGYTYHGNRDLIGFVDGTANPKDQESREAAALVPGTGGGSFLMTQKWVHDLEAFNALSVPEQEGVVGRTKVDDIELEGAAMPDDSHVSRTDASEDGVALKVWRRSSPFGNVSEHGLYYVAFACDIHRFDVQLKRMYNLVGDGLHDRLIEFSEAVSGAYWYAPGAAELHKLALG